ncbi:MAG: signal peptidase [Blastocatellia bacterium]|jgi:signal peptidase I|nr:signal peptidase [Blastocatellia bacterium]
MADKQASESKTKLADVMEAQAEAKPPGPPKSVWREYFESIIVTVLMFLFFITFIGRTVAVPTGSMQNTINIGDHFLINKFIFAPGPPVFFLPQREVRRGDIVVFKYPGDRDHPGFDARYHVTPYRDYYIKRVIALPGETVEVRGAQVLINGAPLPEHSIVAKQGKTEKAPLDILETPPGNGEPYSVFYSPDTLASSGNTPPDTGYFKYGIGAPVKVPDDSYMMMGDNRDNSADSRVWGFVRRDLIIGRALFVFWSYDESAPSGGNFLFDFFRNTRWKRTFTWIK